MFTLEVRRELDKQPTSFLVPRKTVCKQPESGFSLLATGLLDMPLRDLRFRPPNWLCRFMPPLGYIVLDAAPGLVELVAMLVSCKPFKFDRICPHSTCI